MLRAELGDPALRFGLDCLDVVAALLFDLEHDGQTRALVDAAVLEVVSEDGFRLDRSVGEHLDLAFAVNEQSDFVDAEPLDLHRVFLGEDRARLAEDLSGDRGDRGSGEGMAGYSLAESDFLVEFMSSDGSEVVTFGIEEQIVHQDLGGFDDRGLAGTELLVYLFERLVADGAVVFDRLLLARVALESLRDLGVRTEHRLDLLGSLDSESADQDGDGEFAVLVDTDVENVRGIGLVLEPCAAVRDDRCGIDLFAGLVHRGIVVHSG